MILTTVLMTCGEFNFTFDYNDKSNSTNFELRQYCTTSAICTLVESIVHCTVLVTINKVPLHGILNNNKEAFVN